MIGIYDCFGNGKGYDVSFEERYRLIREANLLKNTRWRQKKNTVMVMCEFPVER